jgi:hypothetical protein
MRLLPCVGCRLPVLELDGQTVMLQPYVSVAGTPPVDTAGEWHLTCLNSDPAAGQWGQAHVRSFTEVRRFDRVATTPDWTVVSNPRTGDVLALGRLGAVLTLNGRTIRPAPAGLRVTDVDHWLEWDQPVIARIQARLRDDGSVAVLEVADLLGIRHRLSQPDSLSDSVFRLDPELIDDWTATAVGATVDYVVPLPAELAPYAAR